MTTRAPRISRGSKHSEVAATSTGVAMLDRFVFEEEESNPLASAPAHGRRRAVRAQSQAILHKVGCSWFASAGAVQFDCSAGPTTQPRFEQSNWTAPALQTGEPTV